MDCIRVSLLGPLQVSLNEGLTTTFAYDKVRALLAYLVVNSHQCHSREKLATMLWPESPQDAARTSLRKALSTLRKAIDDQNAFPPFLIIENDHVQFNPASNYWLDLNELNIQLDAVANHIHHRLRPCGVCIQSLVDVANLYGGDFLDGLIVDSMEFEEWMFALREHLRTRVLTALHELTQQLLKQGKYKQAQKYALRQLELEPCREEAHRALMQILAKSGQRSAALTQYETCRRILEEELGVEPSAETQALNQQIRASRNVRPHNLPLPLPALLGREAELQSIRENLANPDCRLLTLVGLGGIGKTSLALQAAQENLGSFLHGVFVVYVESLGTADRLATAVANSLPLILSGQDDPKTQLLDYLRGKSMLLLIDNFEHLLSGGNAAVSLLNEILQTAPELKIMVTSRERLNLKAEWVFLVEGLPYPSDSAKVDFELLPKYAAIQLFEQRARQLVINFSFSGEDYQHVARICQMLGGTPLGIELAAGWIDQYPCKTIADEIEKNLDFLVSPLQDVPDRHQSIRAVFEYSWNLLSKQEQMILGKLSIFDSPFQRETARKVCEALPHHLITYVNKFLLGQTSSGRYTIHPLIKQFLVEALESNHQEAQDIHWAHARYYAEFLQEREKPLVVQHNLMLLEELGQEIADITSAWEWAILQKDFDLLNGQLESLYIYYWARNEFHDGRFAFEQAAEMIRNHVPRKQLLLARMQSKLAEFLAWLGDIESAQKLIQENLSVFRKSHNREYLASELCLRGMTYYWQGQYCQARDAFTEAIELARPIGAKHHLAHAITGLANAICDENADYDDAFELYQESLEIYKELGNEHGIAMNLINQGAILYEQDHYQQAEQLFQQSLDIYRRVDYSYGISAALNYLAGVNRKLGNFESAKELTAESLSLNYETGNRRSILDSLLEIGMLGMEMENYAEAQGYFCEAMQLTLDIGSPELGLKVILGFAGLFEKTGKTERSAELVTFVLAQNGGGQEIREQADDLWAKLEKKLSPVVMERCRSIVKKMDFSDIVADLFCED